MQGIEIPCTRGVWCLACKHAEQFGKMAFETLRETRKVYYLRRVITAKMKHVYFPMTVVFYSGLISMSFAFRSSFYSKLLIRKDFVFGRVLHSGEFYILANFAI